jgi:rhodanese-related sulfurtransferase
MLQKLSLLFISILLSISIVSAGNLQEKTTAIKNEYNSKYPDIEISELKKLMASKSVTILDANGSDSYTDGHLPGAIEFNSENKEFSSLLPSDKNAQIVVYCGSKRCTAWWRAADWASQNGYNNVKHLSAGKKGWKKAGEKLNTSK